MSIRANRKRLSVYRGSGPTGMDRDVYLPTQILILPCIADVDAAADVDANTLGCCTMNLLVTAW
jgi:hypothetical protein